MNRTSTMGWAVTCLMLMSSCGNSEEAKAPITLGLVTSSTGALKEEGISWEIVAKLAIDDINASGGVNGHQLVLKVRDDGTDATASGAAFLDLIDTEGVVAVVGPGFSGAVKAALPSARDRKVPLISMGSTAPSLDLPPDDPTLPDHGFVFRDVPNDNIQGLAMAHYLKTSAMVDSVVVVYEDTPYGQGLADSFSQAYAKAGGTVSNQVALTYTQNLDTPGTTGLVDKMATQVSPGTTVVLVALEQDALKIVTECDARQLGVHWFFTDGERSAGFLAGLPAAVIDAHPLGTAPTNPSTGDAHDVLAQFWNDSPEGSARGSIGEQAYGANTWDAVFLIAAALAQQEHDYPGEVLGGDHLRDAITKVSRDGQIFHAGQWTDILAAIRAGADVDYDGASGPVDFDDHGETIGPYEVWQIGRDANNNPVFNQVEYLEAKDIKALAGG